MRIFTIFLTLWIIALSAGGIGHASSMEASKGSSIEKPMADKYAGNSLNLNENHCGAVCINISCHSGLCHVLTKNIQIDFTDLDLTSLQIISNFRKPKSPYLEGDKKPPKLS